VKNKEKEKNKQRRAGLEGGGLEQDLRQPLDRENRMIVPSFLIHPTI
jgi:hypothetical protein